MTNSSERRGISYVAVAVLFFSTSPVLVRWAAESLSSYEIAAGRLLTAGVVICGLAFFYRQPLPQGRQWLQFGLFGLITALHFGLYIVSLEFTTIAHSLALVYTAPIFVALFSWFFLDEGLNRRKWLGTLVAVIGVAVLAGFEPHFDQRMLIGDLLALGSAVCFGLYSVAGRSQRNAYGLFAYAGVVYLLGGLWLLPSAWSRRSGVRRSLPPCSTGLGRPGDRALSTEPGSRYRHRQQHVRLRRRRDRGGKTACR